MTGSSPSNGSTNGRHPNLLLQQGKVLCCGDKLRRMAIRNSYETRSLSGTSAISRSTKPSAASPAWCVLPPLHSKQPPAVQRLKRRGISPASLLCMEGRPRSSSNAIGSDILTSQKELLSTLKRSSSHSSVAVNRTTPTLHNGMSSYVFPTPSSKRATTRGCKRVAYENIKLKDTQTPPLHRSSSCSTVTANGTSLSSKPAEEKDKTLSQCSPSVLEFPGQSCSQGSSPYEEVRNDNPHSKGLLFQSAYNRHNQAFEVWGPDIKTIEARYPRMFKRIEHSSGKMKHDQERRIPSNIHYSMDSQYRDSYQSPQSLSQFDRNMPITRFGSTPIAVPVTGIVPHLMYPRSNSASQMQAKRVRLHTPKGRKVASLV